MKLKTFILTFLMMSCSIVFGQGTETASAKSEAQIMMHLATDEVGTITIANNISIGNTIEIPNGKKVTIDLNGHELSTNEEIYIFKNFGKLTITDSDPEGKGTIIAPLGIYNGKPQTRTISTDINYNIQLTINGGKFVSTSSNVSAAIYNHLGVINIRGGEFYGEYSAITNYGMANIENTYIECLNRDKGAAAIINDFEIEYGENVRIVGRYTTATQTGVITPSDYKPTYLFAELDGTKYPSLQAALDACTTGDNTINLLFHNSDNATVSQEEGINITIVGNGYKNKQFEYTGTIYVNGNSRSTGAETLTIQDVDFYTEKDTHDFISCNDGGNSVIRYAHNVTVQDCNFTATEGSTAVVALRFRQSYNINVVKSEFTNLHSAMWATGTSGIAFDNIKATKCKEGGISAGTSTPVNVKNSIIEGAKYGVRADGSGDYRLTVESSELTAEVPVIVRNTTGEYNLTVKEDATLASTNNGPQVVVTAGKDNEAYVTPTSDVNVTLDNVTSTFGLTAKIGNAFYATLQDAIDNAIDGDEIVLVSDVTEDVTVTQKADLDLIIAGAGKKFTGVMTVFGDARHDGNETLTIKDINFVAKNGSDACILSPDRTAQNPARYSYSHNVTVENCSFTDVDGNVNCAAIRHNDGGDVNWTLNKCTVDNTMHSLIQTNNVNGKLVIAECTVNSKNGVNLNSCTNVEMTGCNFDVQGYALRSGVGSGGNLGVAKTYVLENNTLKSACDDGDAVIMFRASSVDANFSMEKNVVSGATHISGNTAATKIAADENYWDGKEAPVVAEGSAPIVVNSYYSDDALTNLVRNEMGSIYAFVSSDRIFGDVTTNAKESIKIEIIGKDGNLIGTSSLENLSYATGFNKQLTWRINLGDDDSDSWAMTWEEGCPSINNMPTKVKLYVDAKEGDAAVAEAEIKYTANGDGQSPVFAAKTNANGKINSFIACEGKFNLNEANTFLANALTAGDNVAITVAGTYAVPTGKNLTITGAVDGVKFNMASPVGIHSSMTFNNVTFEYGNANYVGLQHAGTMVYNNCIINGQVFLYGTSETFNNCTFNQNSSDAYNVWTYGAKEVAFNECIFNSAGKSVLVYNEGACATDLTVTDTKFIATATVDDKAAIEIDCSLMPKGTSIVIDGVEEGKTTATGFGANTKSGSSLWNDKKVVEGAPNGGTSSEVIIDDVVVKEPALMNLAGGGTEENPYLISNLEDLIWFRYQVNAGVNNYADKHVKLAANINLESENWTPIGDITYNSEFKPADDTKVFSGVFDGNNMVISNLTINRTVGGADTQANVGLFGITGEGAVIKDLTLTNVNIETDGRNVGALAGFAYKATLSNITVNGNIQIKGGNNVAGVAGMTRYYDMSATNIKVIGNDGSAIVGNNIVGGIFAEIAPNGSAQTFESLSVENVAINGVGGVGGIVGLLTTGAVDNVTVKDVVLTGRTDYQGNAMGRIRLGSVAGLMGGKYATIANVTTENVTAKNLDGNAVELPVIGANYDASSNATEARIGDTYYATLKKAIDAAEDGDVVTLIADVTEDEVLITQKADVDVTIDGNDKTFTGHMTIFGSGRHTGAETLTIKNVVFQAVDGKGECIASATNINGVNSYAHNVTIDNCSFNGNDTYSADNTFAIRFPSGGVGYDLTVTNCTADDKMFGLLWVTQVVGELIVDECTAEGVKEGIVLTSTTKATITNTTIDASNVAIRAGQQVPADGTINEFTFNNNTLKSDAIAIQLRGDATDANLSMTKNVVKGTTHISGNTTDTNIDADANYWGEGLTGPVVAGTNVDVNSYYADEAREQLIVTALTLQQFVEKVTEGNGTYNGTFIEGGVEKNITVKVVPVSGDARSTNDVRVPNRLQKYTNPEVYYAQYQRFSELTDVNISNVNFVFYPAAVTVTDAWNTAGATTTADNINGELQLLNTGSVSFANCSFDKMSVSPINAAKLSVTSSTFNGLDAYAIKDVKATTATITGTTFTDCNGGFWFNNAPTTLTVTDNTFTGTGRRGAIQFSANGDYANTEMTVTGNEVTDEAAFLWQLNNTISNAQLNAILDKNNNTYETAFVEGSVELHLQGEGTADNPYLINDISDLEFFRDQVNADNGNTYEGKYIKVTATEIDLNNEEWTPIAYKGKTFKGNFDGNNVTVKNLKITKALTNSAENNGIGFFGRTDDPATIENIIIENVDITGSLYVGAIVGYGYTGKHVKGCTVKGNIAIDAWWYAGVIGGNGYMNLIDNCHVIGNDGSYIKGNDGSYIGGIWGFRGEGNNKITNCTVTNLDIIGVDRVGGICGIGHYGNTISGCDAEDVTVTATDSDATTIGLLVGATQGNDISGQGPTIFEDNDASGITAQIDNGDGTYTEVTNLYGTNINGSTPVTNYVAQIVGGTQYATLAEAVAAAVNNDVITLLPTPTDAPIAMNAALYGKNVTITGTATVDWSKGWFFVGRGGEGNATVTFDGANLTSASTNENSGLGIHVSGREKNTDNKYDGTLVIKNSTIELDYLIDRGAITIDNATLTVKNGFGIAGRPGTETESGEDATATITLNNESKVVVNNHNGMGLGIAATQLEGFGIMNINSGSTFETTQSFTVTAKGTMNVNGGNVKTVGTLTNSGTINVTGESTLNIEKLEGSSIDLNEGAIVKNSTVGGAAYVAGNVLFRGDNTFAMITDYGDYYSSTTPSMWTVEAGASLTLTTTDRYGLGYGDKVTVYGEIEDALTARESLTDADASVNMYGGLVGMTNSASPDANNVFKAEDAYLIFGVNGDKSFGNKSGNYYGNYDIDFTNCVVTANGFKFYEDKGNSDVYFNNSDLLVNGVLMTNDASSNFTFENSVVLSKAENNGTDDKNQNAGVLTLVNTTMTYSAAFTNVGNLNIGENSTFTAPEVVNNGTINFTALTAKLTAQEGLTIVDKVNDPDYAIAYLDGTYQYAKYVAQIGDEKYLTLQEAIDAAQNDETITLLVDVEQADGVIIDSKNIVVDLNENTFTVTEGANTINRNFKIIGTSVVTIKNGTMIAAGDYSSGAYGTVRTEGAANVTLTGLKLYNYRGNGLNIKALGGTTVEIDNTEIYSQYGGGIEAAGGTITLAETVNVEQKGMYTAPYNSMAISVNGGGLVTVNGGTYSTECITAEEANNQGTSHGPWVVGVLNSGGTLIINGGTFSNDNFGDNSLATYARGAVLADTKANVQIYGGTFNALEAIIDMTNNLDDANNNPSALLSGGTFSADPRISGMYASHLIVVAQGYNVVENENGTFSVVEDQVAKIGDVTYKLLQEAFDAAQDGDEIVVLKEIVLTAGVTVAADKVVVLDLNGKTISMQDASNNSAYAIKNNGNLTIKDSDSAKGGKITFNSTTPDNSFGYATSTIGNGGHLTIENGLIENTTVGGASYAVDGIWHTGEASLTINDGTITATKIAVRQVPFSATAKNTVTINGGTLTGETAGLQMFNINNDAKLSETIIKGGEFNGTYAFYTTFTSAQASELATINIDGGTFNGYVCLYNGKNGSNAYPMTVAITDGNFEAGAWIYTYDNNGNEVPIKAISGGIFSVDPSDYCADNYGAVELPDGTWFVRMLAGTQTREFANAGWYWFSTYIQNMEGPDGLTTLKSELDGKGKEIKSQHGGTRYYPAYNSWTSALTSLSTSEMYMINTTDPVTVEFNGDFVEYESRTINLVEGWNWIGYPVSQELDINVALKNLQAKPNDYIKGKNDGEDAWFIEGYGWWSKTKDFKFKPGHGYMYQSQQATSFTFNAVGGEDVNTDVRRSVANNYHWNADATQYPNNMTMVAVVDGIDDNEYEVAAFVNGEVRGSARPAYFEPLDTYILVLTIHGDDVEEMTFKYYDLSTNTEYDLNNKINYSNDAIVGSIYEPYMLTRGTTGIGEAAMSQVNIYPNPTTTGTEINLEATCDKVEVFNALGVKVVEYQNVDTIDALETAGIYVIRITNNGNVQNCRLVVK